MTIDKTYALVMALYLSCPAMKSETRIDHVNPRSILSTNMYNSRFNEI